LATTLIPWLCRIETMRSAPVAASKANDVVGAQALSEQLEHRHRVRTRPADLTLPPSAIATSQKSR
jgi:hypothetical protein